MRLVEVLPVVGVDAVDEQVGVERGLGHEGQHLAVARIDGHQRAAPVAVQLLHQRLQLDVDRQLQRVARRGRLAGELAHGAAAGGGLDLLEAGGAVQLRLVALLQAQLADVLGAAVVGLVLVRPVVDDLLLFFLVDAADVAHEVARELAVRIVAEQPRLDLHAREAEALRDEARHLLVGELGADRHRLEALALGGQAREALAVARRHLDHLGDLVDRGLPGRPPWTA